MDIVGEDRKSLYEVFSLCEVQIGVDSTALFEGMGFQLQTLIYAISGSEAFEDLCRQKYVSYINDAEECLNAIVECKAENEGEFWEKDSLEKMIKELNQITGRK